MKIKFVSICSQYCINISHSSLLESHLLSGWWGSFAVVLFSCCCGSLLN